MNLCVQVDRRSASQWDLEVPMAADGAIVSLSEPHSVLAAVIESNPLSDGWMLDDSLAMRHTVIWSGSLADDWFESHPMNWMRPGHEAFNRLCDRLRAQLEQAGGIALIRPHCRHILSDPQSCMRFLLDREGEPFDIALAPADLLEVSMLDQLEDHLHRAFEAIGGRCAMLMLHDLRRVDGVSELEPVPLGSGILPNEIVSDLIARHVPANTPIVLQTASLDGQLEWLGAGTSR